MTILAQIDRMKNGGIFRDHLATEDPVEFREYNLIYGFNGTGKSTFSRILDHLSVSGPNPNIPDGIEFRFTATNGDVFHTPADPGQKIETLFVFSEDFVERSLKWGDAEANPVVYIGEEQTDIAMRLDKLQQQRPDVSAKVTKYSAEWAAASKAEKKHCTDTARHVSEELGIVRGYDARSLRTDYENQEFAQADILDDEARIDLKRVIFESRPPELFVVPDFSFSFLEKLKAVEAVTSARLEEVAVASLERRKDAMPWIADGLHIHTDEAECLFCGNELHSERVALLKQVLSSGFEELNRNLDECAEQIKESERDLQKTKTQIDGLPKLHATVESKAVQLRSKLSEDVLLFLEALHSALDAIVSKQANPNASTPFKVLEEVALTIRDFETAAQQLKQLFREHNAVAENHAQLVEKQKEKLKQHILASTHGEYENLVALEADSKSLLNSAETELRAIDTQVGELKNELSEHGPAADRMNQLIASYLGHDRISIEVQGEGYSICRDRKAINKPLSEGEKTAIAFCYFLVLLTGEGRKLSDLIVVIDDPISSLDTRAMAHVVSLIKFSLDSCAQLFISTHNIDFLWEMKKWLNGKRLKDQAAFLFLNSIIRPNGTRESRFDKLPAIIREYESEYHYLYSLVHKAANEEGGIENYMYLLPNTLRKLLETYLAFKRPGFSDLNGLPSLLESNDAIDKTRVRALEALAQSESHSQSIGQTVTFSQYTLEQIVDASKTFLHLVELTDPLHFERMEKLAQKVPTIAA